MTDNDYLPAESVKIEYHINHPNFDIRNRVANSFRYYDLAPMGLGPEGRLFINLDEYLDLSYINKVYDEFQHNLHRAVDYLVPMIPFGLIPRGINNEKCLDSYLLNPDRYHITTDNFGHARSIHNFHALKQYYVNRFNLTKSWKRVLHLRKPLPFYEKGNASDWNPCIVNFPLLKKLIESLPFKHMGIGLIFRSNEESKLLIHRDSFARNHNMHHINISISKDTRDVFIYDPISSIRHYLTRGTRSYTFNEIDLHGADPQFDHLVLRVDGQFEDWFAKAIGLEDGISFNWAYDRPQQFIKEREKINIWTETDI